MTGPRIYLDYNATAPMRPEARTAFVAALDAAGNPSSIHAEGRAARALLEGARVDVAAPFGADPRQVVFTSGATEAAALALAPSFLQAAGAVPLLLISAGEHPCVLSGHRFPAADAGTVPLDSQGRLDLEALAEALGAAAGRPVILALQAANNETGVIQPVQEAARLVHDHGGLVVCDAVQAAGRIDLSAATLGADAVFLSAHKLGGPKGAGALVFVKGGLDVRDPLIRGGGQERGRRAGTENVAGIAGFGAAMREAEALRVAEAARLLALREVLEGGLRRIDPGVTIFGEAAPRLPNTTAFALPDLSAETLLMRLDLEGFAVSSGSACSSGKVAQSHVLAAMGVDPGVAKGAIRVSTGHMTTSDEIAAFCDVLEKAVRTLRSRRSGKAA